MSDPDVEHFVKDGLVLEAVHVSPTEVLIRPCQCRFGRHPEPEPSDPNGAELQVPARVS